MVKDHGRAEDVTQEVFVSALRRMRATERPIAFKPWIYEIARNACIDAYRRGAPRRGGLLRRRRQAEPRRPRPPRRRRARSRPRRSPPSRSSTTCCGAFGGLSDAHHEILVLRELEGLSYAAIGERHGHEPRGRREHALPRPQAARRGVRRARVRRALPARPGDHRRRRERQAGRPRRAPARPPRRPLPAVPAPRAAGRPRGPGAPRPSAGGSPRWLPLPGFLRFGGWGTQRVAELLEPGWGKVAAGAAALLLAGGGRGAGS